MTEFQGILMVAVIAGVTAFLRFIPFLVFGGKKKTPPYITYLSGVLPYAIMGMLVVYCLKNVNLLAPPHGICELLGGEGLWCFCTCGGEIPFSVLPGER